MLDVACPGGVSSARWSRRPASDSPSSLFDYIHLNSVDVDQDGNILISARTTSALYKIDRQTGDVIFIFGGKSNQFTYVGDLRHLPDRRG